VFRYGVETLGLSEQKAADIAVNLTVNFSRRGTASGGINAAWMFFNASVQGSAAVFRHMSTMPRKRAAQITGGIVSLGMAQFILGVMMGGDDDDGQSYYEKLVESKPFLFERSMVFMIPGGKGRYISIPMPWGYNSLYNIGHEFSRASFGRGDYDALKGAARIVNSIATSFNPVQSATLLQAISPTILDPAVMIRENIAWHGGPIMPERNPYSKTPIPDNQRYFGTVTAPSRIIAKTMSDLTGGDSAVGGALDISPETIDLWTSTITGSAGRFIAQTYGLPIKATSEGLGAIQPREVPIARAFYGKLDEHANQSIYYQHMELIARYRARRDNAESPESRSQLRMQYPVEAALLRRADIADKRLRRLNKIKRTKRDAGASSLEMQEIQQRIDGVYKMVNAAWNEAV
jgi:hypothetical protein